VVWLLLLSLPPVTPHGHLLHLRLVGKGLHLVVLMMMLLL
jgi:hypothetical protein